MLIRSIALGCLLALLGACGDNQSPQADTGVDTVAPDGPQPDGPQPDGPQPDIGDAATDVPPIDMGVDGPPPAPEVQIAHSTNGNQLILDTVGDVAEPGAYGLATETDIWELHFRDGADAVVASAKPSNSTFTSFNVTPTTNGGFIAEWLGGTTAGLPAANTFDVRIEASIGAGARVVEMTIDVTMNAPLLALDWVDFPRLQVDSRGTPADQRFTFPTAGGWLFVNPINVSVLGLGTAALQTHPGLSMQWFSYYNSGDNNGPALFLGTRDGVGHFKQFWVDNSAGTLGWGLRHTPANHQTLNQSYSSPYPAVVGIVRGNWYDAARFYRAWAVQQSWTANGPMHSSSEFSSLVRDGDAYSVTGPSPAGSSDYQYWLGLLNEVKAYFDVTSLPTHIYGWHNNEFDVDWGNWLPIKSEFVTHGPAATAAGAPHAPYTHIGVYGSHAGVPSYTSSYVPGFVGDSVADYVLKDRQGQLSTGMDAQNQPSVHLCYAAKKGGLNFTGELAKYLADQVVSQGGSRGLYLDVFTFSGSELCYAQNHEHDLGGGSHYTTAKRDLVKALRADQRQNDPQFFVYSEAQDEMFVDIIELVYPHNTGEVYNADVRSAPLFETVYHDYKITGRVAPVVPTAAQLPVGDQARTIRRVYAADLFMGYSAWLGILLSNTTFAQLLGMSVEYTEFVELVRSAVKVLKQAPAKRFVRFGARLRDPQHDAPLIPQQPNDILNLPYRAEQPLVYVSAWSDSQGQGMALLLTNWTTNSDAFVGGETGGLRDVTWTIDPAQYPIQPGMYELHLIDDNGASYVKDVDLSATLQETTQVPAKSARVVYLLPKTP